MLVQRGQNPYKLTGKHCHCHETPLLPPPHQISQICACLRVLVRVRACAFACVLCVHVRVHLRICWGSCMLTCACACLHVRVRVHACFLTVV